MKFGKLKIILLILMISAVGLILVLWFHGVNNEITSEDRIYIPKYTENFPAASGESPYEEQIEFIRRVQDAVLSVAPVNKGLPYRQEREPKDLYEARFGLCFDRSRVIEKILRFHGFETRHIFIYSVKDSNALKAFATPSVPSHAVTEVKTQKGWLVIDSNDRWISLDSNGNPVAMSGVTENKSISWQNEPPPIYTTIAPFTYVYGLYSRHGEFYPPYNFIPDVHYGELMDNIF
jgi:hypothetical protein